MKVYLAGSAITQGVGRIDQWEEWKPTKAEVGWLLIGGFSDPPTCILKSDRLPYDMADGMGKFLDGMRRDFFNFEELLRQKKMFIYNTFRNRNIKKHEAIKAIIDLFNDCTQASPRRQPSIYYTGHGEVGTGNWCFGDGTLSITEIEEIIPKGCYHPLIFSDCCYSGHWANHCLNKNRTEGIADFYCLSACPEYATAYNIPTSGGELTSFMTGRRKQLHSEPLWSGKTRLEAPLVKQETKLNYSLFMAGMLKNNSAYPISQTLYGGKLSVLFGYDVKYSTCAWLHVRSISDLIRCLDTQLKDGRTLHSLVCNEHWIGMFFSKDYGEEQFYIITDDISSTKTRIEEAWDDDKMITSIGSYQSSWIIIMTLNAPHYECEKSQTYFTSYTWAGLMKIASNKRKDDFIVTGLCYNSVFNVYLCVMTYDENESSWNSFSQMELTQGADEWIDEQADSGFYVSNLFHIPSSNKMHITATANKQLKGLKSYYFGVELTDSILLKEDQRKMWMQNLV